MVSHPELGSDLPIKSEVESGRDMLTICSKRTIACGLV